MANETKTTAAAIENAPAAAPQEKKKLRRLFVFQNQEYDLNNLTAAQKEYLKQFPEQVPFVK